MDHDAPQAARCLINALILGDSYINRVTMYVIIQTRTFLRVNGGMINNYSGTKGINQHCSGQTMELLVTLLIQGVFFRDIHVSCNYKLYWILSQTSFSNSTARRLSKNDSKRITTSGFMHVKWIILVQYRLVGYHSSPYYFSFWYISIRMAPHSSSNGTELT